MTEPAEANTAEWAVPVLPSIRSIKLDIARDSSGVHIVRPPRSKRLRRRASFVRSETILS